MCKKLELLKVGLCGLLGFDVGFEFEFGFGFDFVMLPYTIKRAFLIIVDDDDGGGGGFVGFVSVTCFMLCCAVVAGDR